MHLHNWTAPGRSAVHEPMLRLQIDRISDMLQQARLQSHRVRQLEVNSCCALKYASNALCTICCEGIAYGSLCCRQVEITQEK